MTSGNKRRLPPLTPEQVRRAQDQLAALYGDRTLPAEELERQRRAAEQRLRGKGRG